MGKWSFVIQTDRICRKIIDEKLPFPTISPQIQASDASELVCHVSSDNDSKPWTPENVQMIIANDPTNTVAGTSNTEK